MTRAHDPGLHLSALFKTKLGVAPPSPGSGSRSPYSLPLANGPGLSGSGATTPLQPLPIGRHTGRPLNGYASTPPGSPGSSTGTNSTAAGAATLYPLAPHLSPLPSPSTTPPHTRPSSRAGSHLGPSRRSSVAASGSALGLQGLTTTSAVGGRWEEQTEQALMSDHMLGRMTVRITQARGLNARKTAKPYVLLQYDRTDSVSKEFGADPPLPRKPAGPAGAAKRRNGLGRGLRRPELRQTQSSITVRRVGFETSSTANGAGASGSATMQVKTLSSPAATTTTRRGEDSDGKSSSDETLVNARQGGAGQTRRAGFESTGGSAPGVNHLKATPPTFSFSRQGANGAEPAPKEEERIPEEEDVPGEEEAAGQDGTPQNPIWDHSAMFDVVEPSRTILICVYDKTASAFDTSLGFLGAVVFEPALMHDPGSDGRGQDFWLPLSSEVDPTLKGEVHVRLLFERLKVRPRLSVKDFEVLKRIGEGSFGQVFRVRKKDTRRVYAMKVISKDAVAEGSALTHVLAERKVLQRTLDSPFLVGLKFSFQSSRDLFFVMDFVSGGELFSHLQNGGGKFEEGRVRFYMAEVMLGLKFLHAANIIYRDLKPENVLLDGLGHVVLVDFGLSKLVDSSDSTTRTFCGTTEYMAPEILLDTGYDRRADYWSLGVLLFEMGNGWSPFYAESRVEKYERILSSPIKVPTKRGFSAENTALILALLIRDPAERLGSTKGVEEIQEHPFFASVDWLAMSKRKVSPPFKPPQRADDDDFYEQGRPGEWFFRVGDGDNDWRAKAHEDEADWKATMNGDKEDYEREGLYRDFTFTARFDELEDQEAASTTAKGRRSSWDCERP